MKNGHKILREKDGFTLVELLVSILCCSIITFAAMSLTLTGMRVEVRAEEAVTQQQTARIVLSLVERLAGSGEVRSVENLSTVAGQQGDWTIWGGTEEDPFAVLRYHAGTGTLTTGDGAPLMEGVTQAGAAMEGRLLRFTFTSGEQAYRIAVFCRTAVQEKNSDPDDILSPVDPDRPPENISQAEYQARYHFLELLCSQAGSTGQIKGTNTEDDGTYYSQWYIGEKNWNQNGWNKDTPWCACFVSWAMDQRSADLETVPKFSGVSDGYTKLEESGLIRPIGENPVPGDLIFFDLDKDPDPDHVGVVLYVDGAGSVYTIEGNSGGMVRLHSYDASASQIHSYGRLDWKPEA